MGPSSLSGPSDRCHCLPMTQRELQDLPPDECFALLGTAKVGRLVYQDGLGPVAIPVNYAMAGTDIVIRIEGGTKRAALRQPMLGFEVDHIDDRDRSGWSVVARGSGREVPPERVSSVLGRIAGGPPVPWAVGIHNVWMQITPESVTGRRLGAERVAPLI